MNCNTVDNEVANSQQGTQATQS